MKITFFSSKPYDKEFFDKANRQFNFELDYFETHLGPHVLNLIENTDAVCAFVNDKLDAEVLESLAKKGVKYIALRCAGFNNVDLDAAFFASIQKLKKGDILDVKSLDIKEGETSPPKRYNSGSMILAMENAGQLIEDEELREQIKGSGIGTSATRAEIIKKLVRIHYLNLNKRTQVLTPENLGEMVFEVVSRIRIPIIFILSLFFMKHSPFLLIHLSLTQNKEPPFSGSSPSLLYAVTFFGI